MEKLRHIFLLTIILALTSCGPSKKEFPKSSFDSPFPKRNCNLTNIFGEQLTVKSGTDTLILNISTSKKFNLITKSENGDTLFYGTVCRFRGLYYFNEQLNDSSYWIYAVKATDNLIYGLNTASTQMFFVDRAIENGNYKKLVKYITSDKIRLHPDKKELKKLFTAIIDSITPDTILLFQETTPIFRDTTKTITQIDPEEFEYFSNVYPNPTSDFINIELQQKNKLAYQLTDMQGKTVLQGQFADKINTIDLRKQPDGIYALTLISLTDKQKETVKIIKGNK